MYINQAGVDKLKKEQAKQKALDWWNKVPTTLMAKYTREIFPGRYAFGLNSDEIQAIYESLNR